MKDVALAVTTSGPLEVAAEAKKTLSFAAVGDEVVDFRLRTKPGLGVATATVTATSGTEKAARRSRSTSAARPRASTDVLGGTVKPGETLDARDRAARPRGDEPGDARGLPRPAPRPRPAARVPDSLPARLRRADRLRRVPAALPRQAPRALAREAGPRRDEREGRARAPPPLPGDRRRVRLLAGRRRLGRLGHELRRPLRRRGAEGRLPPAPGPPRPVDGLPAPARRAPGCRARGRRS